MGKVLEFKPRPEPAKEPAKQPKPDLNFCQQCHWTNNLCACSGTSEHRAMRKALQAAFTERQLEADLLGGTE